MLPIETEVKGVQRHKIINLYVIWGVFSTMLCHMCKSIRWIRQYSEASIRITLHKSNGKAHSVHLESTLKAKCTKARRNLLENL